MTADRIAELEAMAERLTNEKIALQHYATVLEGVIKIDMMRYEPMTHEIADKWIEDLRDTFLVEVT